MKTRRLPSPSELAPSAVGGAGSIVIKIATALDKSDTRPNSTAPKSAKSMPSFTERSFDIPGLGHDLSVVTRTLDPCATPLHGSTRQGKHGKKSKGPFSHPTSSADSSENALASAS